MKKINKIECNLLKTLCKDVVEDENLYRGFLNCNFQLYTITKYCNCIELKLSEMIQIGKEHYLDEHEELIVNINMYFQLAFEDIVRNMCEKTTMSEDMIDKTIDKICLSYETYDSQYGLSFTSRGKTEFIKKRNNLHEAFSLYDLIDSGTEIEITNDGEFGYINGKKYDIANLEYSEINTLLLSMLKTAKNDVVSKL